MEMANRDIGIIAFKDLGPEEGGEGQGLRSAEDATTERDIRE
jgi:hypothetical protein